MIIVRTAQELSDALSEARKQNRKIGFVPTMGALHTGHLSLVDLAARHSDFVAVSIFVNPTQFAPHEDFDKYPRNSEKDIALLRENGKCDLVYLPRVEDIYGDNFEQQVLSGDNAKGLESDFRPHFFDGVLNVVHRLFGQVKPDIAVFGEKDYQQLAVIKESVETIRLPVEVIGAPIARDTEGLALSSRNAYLSADELKIARQMNKILAKAVKTRDAAQAEKELIAAGFDKVDYIAFRWGRILSAAWLGKTRLIDNLPSP